MRPPTTLAREPSGASAASASSAASVTIEGPHLEASVDEMTHVAAGEATVRLVGDVGALIGPRERAAATGPGVIDATIVRPGTLAPRGTRVPHGVDGTVRPAVVRRRRPEVLHGWSRRALGFPSLGSPMR